jgi:hypothetical protein
MLIFHSKLKEVLSLLQVAFDSYNEETTYTQQYQNLALLQIVVPDAASLEMAKKIVDGISLPQASCTPFHIIFSTEPIPPGYVLVTCMVLLPLSNRKNL